MIERALTAYLAGAANGRRYTIDVAKLTPQEQHELHRLIRDLVDEREAVRRDVRVRPWKYL